MTKLQGLNSGPGVNPTVLAGIKTILSVPSTSFRAWMEQLASSIQASDFDQTYEQLLGQGLDQLSLGYTNVMNSAEHPFTADDAKEFIRTIALDVANNTTGNPNSSAFLPEQTSRDLLLDPQIIATRNLLINFLRKVNTPLYDEPTANQIADEFTNSLVSMIGFFQGTGLFNLVDQRGGFINVIDAIIPLGGDPVDVLKS